MILRIRFSLSRGAVPYGTVLHIGTVPYGTLLEAVNDRLDRARRSADGEGRTAAGGRRGGSRRADEAPDHGRGDGGVPARRLRRREDRRDRRGGRSVEADDLQ